MNFGGGSEPAVIFDVDHRTLAEIQKQERTVMEAFMAGKIKVQGPMEFAMQILALAPEDDD